MSRLLPLLLLGACAAPDAGDAFTTIELVVHEDAAGANTAFVELADGAAATLAVALPRLDDEGLADAVIGAHDRGVDVAVVTDVDEADAAGALALAEAGVPLTLADGPVGYFDFSSGNDIAWTSEQVRMRHAFAVADRDRLVIASGAGDLGPGARVVLHGQSEELAEDLLDEHTQVFGGTDAAARTAFDALAKSIADARTVYATQDETWLEVWFNPQERATKRLIDAVYAARSSIRVVTEDLADEGLARALQRKAEDGFDVEVLVGASFGATSSALSDVLRNKAPDVAVLQSYDPVPLPTIVFVDFDKARDGRFHTPRALVLGHPIWSAARTFAGSAVVTDQLVDATLVVLGNQGEPTLPLKALADVYADRRATAEAL